MRLLKFILGLLIVSLVIIIAIGAVIINNWTRGPLPQHDGEISVAGLNEPVEIYRDEWGVPHVYASNVYDLFFAQGYTQAQDRWWQMEFSRATGDGRIQELTGANASAMGSDLFIRMIGWRRAAERDVAEVYDDETLAFLQAFADGVNAYTQSRGTAALAMEYNLLGITGVNIELREWTVADSVVWSKVMAWSLSDRLSDAGRQERFNAFGEEKFAHIEPVYPFNNKPTVFQIEDIPGLEQYANVSPNRLDAANVTLQLINPQTPNMDIFGGGDGVGSNSWVVSGEHTETGLPLMANDPHLAIQMPSIWYEIGLHCQPISDECPYNVRGYALPAMPGVVIGHNDHISWGFTNVGPDVNDLYLIKVNPDNDFQYKWNDEWRDMTIHEEVIRFGDGGEPVTIQTRETHLGPIINDHQRDDDGNLQGFNNNDPMAYRWTALDPSELFRALFEMNRTTNWEEFRAAASFFDAPSQTLLYADVEGNIGLQIPGKIPIRATEHNGLFPVDGTTDAYEWLGFIPYELLPNVLNPERGYIVTANQAIVPFEYYAMLADELGDEYGADANYVIDFDWAYGYRGQRINQMVEETIANGNKFTIELFQTMQGDNKNLSAAELLPVLAELELDGELSDIRDWLVSWDAQMHIDSPQAALYSQFWVRLMNNLYGDEMSANELDLQGGGSQEMWATYLLTQEPENSWWDDVSTDETETRDDILERSLQEALDVTIEVLGENRDDWKWGDLHTALFISNPLGASGIDLIEDMVNRGPVGVGGGTAIVNATSWSVTDGTFHTGGLPSKRTITDLSDFTQNVNMHTTGQSGHPFSEHYGDMIDSWRNLEYKPMLFSREQVEANSVNKLTLNPER